MDFIKPLIRLPRLLLLFFSKLFAKSIPLNYLNYNNFDIKLNFNALKFKEPEFQEINPTYVLIRNLEFHPEIKFQELQKFENIIKWKSSNLNFAVVFRNYPLRFISTIKQFAGEKLALKFINKVKSFNEKQINIAKNIKLTEELLQILPYSRKLNKQKLFRLPISRSPLYKSYFPESELKRFREELAMQNKTRWSNVEIMEIYDKFNVKIFSDIRQTSGSRNLLCYPSFSNAEMKINNDLYYLIIGKRRDTNELVKALSKPVIVQDDSENT